MDESQPKKQNTQLIYEKVQSQDVARQEQLVRLLLIAQQEQTLMKVPPIPHVNPPLLVDIEIHDVHSDLEKE